MAYIGNVVTSFNVATQNINNDAITTEKIADGAILNADVNSAAAIAGTKISPDFGSQNIATTGLFSHALGTAAAPTITFTGDPNTGIYSPGADQVAISTNGTGRVFVDSSGRMGVGTASAARSAITTIKGSSASIASGNGLLSVITSDSQAADLGGCIILGGQSTDPDWVYGSISGRSENNNYAGYLAFATAASGGQVNERLRIDSSGRVGIGTTSPSGTLEAGAVSGAVTAGDLIVSTGSTTATVTIGRLSSTSSDNTRFRIRNRIDSTIFDVTQGTLALGPVDNQITFGVNGSERARIDSSGRLLVNTTSTSAFHVLNRPSAIQGNPVLYVGASLFGSAFFFECNSGLYSAAASAMQVSTNTSTNRSINAGGTINASGTDYAEYMSKAGNLIINKGDICGVDSNGLLIDVFADSVSFVVKSTNPSYVGGDTWGTEDSVGVKPSEEDLEALAAWEANLEAERQKVDRIAFAGQVPVNVTGALPGQYIVPIATEAGGITGTAKDESDLTLAEYMRAVGKVIAIEDDGRARIIVKVA